MYDNKHSQWGNRARRSDFARDRDDRYTRRDTYFTQPYAPKRRKIESGEAETVEFEPRRVPYSPYDVAAPRTTVPRYYSRDPYEHLPRRPHEDSHYYQRDWNSRPIRDYQPLRRYSDVLPDADRKGDIYNTRRLYEDAQVEVGRKRQRPDPNRFLNQQRQFESRTPLSPNTPIKHIASTALNVGTVRDIYEPQIPPPKATEERQGHPLTSSSEQKSPSTADEDGLSKKEIIDRMDQLDNQISQVEEEIEHFKKLKTLCQRKTDKSKLSDVDRILLANQDVASENREYMKLFQKVDQPTKVKANLIHTPDNLPLHTLKRPIMMHHMRKHLLASKETMKKIAFEFDVKQKKWNKKLKTEGICPPKSVAAINNALPPSPLPVLPVETTPRGRRSRTSSDAVRSEAEFTQIMQQLSETEKQDPNLRYLKTLAKIPPLLVDRRETSRVFIDNNRFVEDCGKEYSNYQLTNPWNTEEQDIFLRKYISTPKEFGKIASFLPNKSIEEVICYYFKNKHRLNLKEIIEDIQAKKRPVQRVRVPRKTSNSQNFVNKEVADLHSANGDSSYWNGPRERTRQKPESQRNRERVMPQRSKTSRSTKSRAKSPPRRLSSSKKNLSLHSAGLDQICFVANVPATWNESEINQFKIALASYGSDFKAIADFLSSKNHWQCRSFYYNFKEQLNLAELFARGNRASSKNPPPVPSRSLHLSVPSVKKSPDTLVHSSDNDTQENTTKDWVLEEPPSFRPVQKATFSVSANSSFLPVGKIENSAETTTSPFSTSPRFNQTFPPSSLINIRHSFDSFSPLQNSETENSVTWNVAELSNPLRHSSADVGHFSPLSHVPAKNDKPVLVFDKTVNRSKEKIRTSSLPKILHSDMPKIHSTKTESMPAIMSIKPTEETKTSDTVMSESVDQEPQINTCKSPDKPVNGTTSVVSELSTEKSKQENPVVQNYVNNKSVLPKLPPLKLPNISEDQLSSPPPVDSEIISSGRVQSLPDPMQIDSGVPVYNSTHVIPGAKPPSTDISKYDEQLAAGSVTYENCVPTLSSPFTLPSLLHTKNNTSQTPLLQSSTKNENDPPHLSTSDKPCFPTFRPSKSAEFLPLNILDKKNQNSNLEDKFLATGPSPSISSPGITTNVSQSVTPTPDANKKINTHPFANQHINANSAPLKKLETNLVSNIGTAPVPKNFPNIFGSSGLVNMQQPLATPTSIPNNSVLPLPQPVSLDSQSATQPKEPTEMAEALRFEKEIKIQLANSPRLMFDVNASDAIVSGDFSDDDMTLHIPENSPSQD